MEYIYNVKLSLVLENCDDSSGHANKHGDFKPISA